MGENDQNWIKIIIECIMDSYITYESSCSIV